MKVDDDDDGGGGGDDDDIPYTDIGTHLHVQTYHTYLHVAYIRYVVLAQKSWIYAKTTGYQRLPLSWMPLGFPTSYVLIRAASWPWWAPMAAASPRCCRIFRVGSSPRRAKYGCSPMCASRWWSASDDPKSLTHGGAPPG